jgi:hypothetical protein
MANSIFSYNQMPELGFPNLEDRTTSFTVTNSIFNVITIEGGAFYINELSDVYSGTDPMFADTANGDYTLLEGSPCIDKGIQDTIVVYNEGQDTLFVPPISFIGLAPDMGAYEFDSATNIENRYNTSATFTLHQNYPNPFNPSTTIQFQIPNSQFTALKIYDLLGKEVSTIVSKKLNQGNHTYTFDGKNLASGIYYYQLVAGRYRGVKKMILLK